jgi:hypothetical protein
MYTWIFITILLFSPCGWTLFTVTYSRSAPFPCIWSLLVRCLLVLFKLQSLRTSWDYKTVNNELEKGVMTYFTALLLIQLTGCNRLRIRSNSVFRHDGFLKCTELLKRSLNHQHLKKYNVPCSSLDKGAAPCRFMCCKLRMEACIIELCLQWLEAFVS